MSILTKPIEEILSYIFTKVHGGILLNELDSENFKPNFLTNTLTLKNLKLNPQFINPNLGESPLHMVSGTVEVLRVKFPSLFSFKESVSLQLYNLEVELCSAAQSGYKSFSGKQIPVSESEEDIQGITLLTKTIGNWLANINADLKCVTFNIRDLDQSVCVYIDRLLLEDLKREPPVIYNKNFQLSQVTVSCRKGSESSVVSCLEDAFSGRVTISKEVFSLELAINYLPVVVQPKELAVLLGVLNSLEPCSEYESEKISLLKETYLTLGPQILDRVETQNLMPPPKSYLFNLNLATVTVCLGLKDSQSQTKVWNYTGPYPKFSSSHCVATLGNLSINQSSLKLSTLKGTFYKLSKSALENSDLFVSANEMYTSEFFRVETSQIDETSHFCAEPLISTSEALSVDLQSSEVAFGDLTLNPVLLNQVLKIFPESKNSKPSKQLKVSIPQLKLNLKNAPQENLCMCNEESKLEVVIKDLSVTNQLNGKVSSVNVTLFAANCQKHLGVLENIELTTSESQSEPQLDKTESYEEYFEPEQGLIVIPKNAKVLEPCLCQSLRSSVCQKSCKQAKYRVFVSNLEATLDPWCFSTIKSFSFGESSGNSNIDYSLFVDTLNVSLVSDSKLSLNLRSFSLVASKNSFEDFLKLESYLTVVGDQEICQTKKPFTVLFQPEEVRVALDTLCVDLPLLMPYLNFFESFSGGSSGKRTSVSMDLSNLKVTYNNSAVLVPFGSFSTVTGVKGSSSYEFLLGSVKFYISNQSLTDSEDLDSQAVLLCTWDSLEVFLVSNSALIGDTPSLDLQVSIGCFLVYYSRKVPQLLSQFLKYLELPPAQPPKLERQAVSYEEVSQPPRVLHSEFHKASSPPTHIFNLKVSLVSVLLSEANSYLQVKLKESGVSFYKLEQGWELASSLESFTVEDRVQNSIVKIALKTDGLKFKVKSGVRVWIELKPVELYVDQHTLKFLELFLTESSGEQEDNPCFIEELVIESLCITFNYYPHTVKSLSSKEIINLFQIENFKICLPKVKVSNSPNLKRAFNFIWEKYSSHNYRNIISSIGPISSVKALSTAVCNLVKLPYQRESAISGAKEGMVGLVKAMSVGSLQVVQSTLRGGYGALQLVTGSLGVSLPSRQNLTKPLHKLQAYINNTQEFFR